MKIEPVFFGVFKQGNNENGAHNTFGDLAISIIVHFIHCQSAAENDNAKENDKLCYSSSKLSDLASNNTLTNREYNKDEDMKNYPTHNKIQCIKQIVKLKSDHDSTSSKWVDAQTKYQLCFKPHAIEKNDNKLEIHNERFNEYGFNKIDNITDGCNVYVSSHSKSKNFI